MKILLTGGSGFIGANFIKYMLSKHNDLNILNVDNLTYAANENNLKDVSLTYPNRYTFIKSDFADASIATYLENVDAVVHMAAESHVDNSIKNPNIFAEVNTLGTQKLLEMCRIAKVPKFLLVSTDEVYGHLNKNDAPFSESNPIKPRSPYSASKAGAELFAQAYYETFNFPLVTTRCSNNYGKYQHKEKFIPTIIIAAKNNSPIPVYGKGENIRDWIHVLDHCCAIENVLFNGKIGQVYNVGANNEMTNIDIVKLILKIMNKPESLISYVSDRLGHDFRYAINSDYIAETLNWSPSINFETGLRETINWYLQND